MRLRRIVALAATSCSIVCGAAVAPSTASAAPPRGPQPQAETDWYECIHDSSTPSTDYLLFTNDKSGETVLLDCGGLRHINASHPVNAYTVDCVNRVLHGYGVKETSNTDPNNWMYRMSVPTNGLVTGAAVVTTKVTPRVVTAYTYGTPGYDVDTEWEYCVYGGPPPAALPAA